MNTVEGSLSFLAEHERNKSMFYVPEPAGSQNEEIWPGDYVDTKVTLKDGRTGNDSGEALSLEKEGLAMCKHDTKLTPEDLQDDAIVKSKYFAELESLIKEVTGASTVILFDHTRRSSASKLQVEKKMRQPAAHVHCDYTVDSGFWRLDIELGKEKAAELTAPRADGGARRWQVINVWRPLCEVVYENTLALCDASTVMKSDLVTIERRAPTRKGEVYVGVHSPAQKWYYFSELKYNEAILFKTFDSKGAKDPDSPLQCPPHTACNIPGYDDSAPKRMSIETRAFVFYD